MPIGISGSDMLLSTPRHGIANHILGVDVEESATRMRGALLSDGSTPGTIRVNDPVEVVSTSTHESAVRSIAQMLFPPISPQRCCSSGRWRCLQPALSPESANASVHTLATRLQKHPSHSTARRLQLGEPRNLAVGPWNDHVSCMHAEMYRRQWKCA